MMRPVRLLLDGFGCYRQPTEADFSDVDFFALVGPTGAGKSTVIDGLCFALYGTVPRWGKENAIAQALAPAANACRVCLVFEAGGKRYGAVRALTRDKKGLVHTKEARLELLDPQIPVDSPIADILAASVGQLAEGPDQVKARVQHILGLTYEHFTQSVLLPQGRFSEFLQAKPADRQDLLVELLAFGVYATVGQRARDRARRATERRQYAENLRGDLADATEDAETRVAARVMALRDLASVVEDRQQSLSRAREQAEHAAQQAHEAREQASLLAAIRTPGDVPGLARRISEADQLITVRKQQRDDAETAEAAIQRARDQLPDRTRMATFRQAYADRRDLEQRLARQEKELADKEAARDSQAEVVQKAGGKLQQAREDQAQAERSHAAIALAKRLQVGEDCPVCLRPISALPHHAAPADLERAQDTVESAQEQLEVARNAYQNVSSAATRASSTVDSTREQVEKLSVILTEAASEAEVLAALAAIEHADTNLSQARQKAQAARTAAAAAEEARTFLGEEERRARGGLARTRDSVVQMGAPAIDGADLATAWDLLTGWAQAQHAERSQRQSALDTAAVGLEEQVAKQEKALLGLLAEHDVTEIADPAHAAVAVARQEVHAASKLESVRKNRRKAAELDEQIRACREEQQVAAMLGNLLKATSFERWLCGEALDSLMAEASETLMELSGGQYQLDRDSRNELIVIDYQDAGARRPVHTLSGGETFQASLALALALSRQVIGLSAGMRDLNSMFLDEGFGTLDENTLETVATTLERLATDSDRMVGVITHVPALAERVPVRFVVSHTGGTSTLRKERV
jgi:DNA repair protein SbcC/Rad50